MDFNYFLNSCSITKRVSARRQSLQDLGGVGGVVALSGCCNTAPSWPQGKKATVCARVVQNPFRGQHHVSCLAAVAPAGERRRRELTGETFFFLLFVFEPTECASICLPLVCESCEAHAKTGAAACPPRRSSSFLIRGNAFYVKAPSYLRCPSAAGKH